MRDTIKLNPQEARHALDAAVSTQATIVIESAAPAATTINGFLISSDDAALLLEVTGNPEVDVESLLNSACEAQVYADRRYVFSTEISSIARWGLSRAIAIQRPRVTRVFERRRYARARLAQSSSVSLRWQKNSRTHRHKATILNVSVDGIACRLEASVACGLDKKDTGSAKFELPGFERPFEFAASVTNMTPCSEGCSIVGLQFVDPAQMASEIAALRRAIEGGYSEKEETEAYA